MTTQSGITASEYIQHHLTNLQLNLKTFQLGEGGGFYTLNLDTMIVSLILGTIFLTLMVFVARRATSGVPGNLQNFI